MHRIFVISDLHLGGRPHSGTGTPGSQICHSYGELKSFILWAATQNFDASVELVLNGDIVDFLLDDDYPDDISPRAWTPSEEEVIQKLDYIIKRTRDKNGQGPFEALAAFVDQGNLLTLILGNHDIELSLPKVRKHLLNTLGGNVARVQFVYDGEAYVRGDLLIEHGNRYDRFNIVDHSALRQERSVMSRGMQMETDVYYSGRFIPPAGSLLVTEVFNKLKTEFRFLDLLKPETGAVIPLILALHPKLQHVVNACMTFAKTSPTLASSGFAEPGRPGRPGLLSADYRVSDLTVNSTLDKELGESASLFDINITRQGQLGASDAWQNICRLSGNIRSWITDKSNLFKAISTDKIRRTQLMAALKKLRNDRSFDPTTEDADYMSHVKAIAHTGEFSTIVFGHTHLPKNITFACASQKDAHYINAGTWADLIRLPKALFSGADEEANGAFDAFFSSMQKNDMTPFIVQCRSYAEVLMENDTVKSAHLYFFESPDTPRSDIKTSLGEP